jgi:peroxisomal membrane protein 4
MHQKVLSSLYNGAIYGAKVRFCHSIVVGYLFGRGSLKQLIIEVGKSTCMHAAILGTFSGLYQLVRIFSGGNSLISGAVSGALIGGIDNTVNGQINMYTLSRVLIAAVRVFVQKGWLPDLKWGYKIYAAFCHGMLMYLFENHSWALQKSLTGSLKGIHENLLFSAVKNKSTQ